MKCVVVFSQINVSLLNLPSGKATVVIFSFVFSIHVLGMEVLLTYIYMPKPSSSTVGNTTVLTIPNSIYYIAMTQKYSVHGEQKSSL